MIKHPIRQIGNRVAEWMGADRELAMFCGLLSAVMIVVALDWLAFFFGIGLWFFCIWVLRRMAKADSLMRFVYIRSIRYKRYYPAHSTPFYENEKLRE